MRRRKWLSRLLLNLVNRGMKFERFKGNVTNGIKIEWSTKRQFGLSLIPWLMVCAFSAIEIKLTHTKNNVDITKDMRSFPIF